MSKDAIRVSVSAQCEIQRLFGFGYRTASFFAKLTSGKVARRVALKAYWDAERAVADMAGLAETYPVQGVPDLLLTDEVDREALLSAVGPSTPTTGMARLRTLPPRVPVAVMAQVEGEALFTPLPEDSDTPGWPASYGPDPWAEGWRQTRDDGEGLRLFTKLVEVVEACHRLERPKVHGDLSPANVFFQPETGRIWVTDYLKWDPIGTPGWDSPWHGPEATLRPAADVYSLILWGLRLLGPSRHRELLTLLSLCSGDSEDAGVTALELLAYCKTL